jgi:hypothetical protein
MENLDLIIFTIVLILLFSAVAIGTIAEFNRMGKELYDEKKDQGGIVSLKNFIGRIMMGSKK